MTLPGITIYIPVALLIGFLLIGILMLVLLAAVVLFQVRIMKLLAQSMHAQSNPSPANQAPIEINPARETAVLPELMAEPNVLVAETPDKEEHSDQSARPTRQMPASPVPCSPAELDNQLLAAIQAAEADKVDQILLQMDQALLREAPGSADTLTGQALATICNLRQLLYDFNENETGSAVIYDELPVKPGETASALDYLPVIRPLALQLVRQYQRWHAQKKSDIVLQAKTFIEQNYQSPLTVNAIAAALFISAPYLYRLMREEIGVSPAHYLNNLRLRHATALLRNSGLPIAQIAAESGFETEQSFFRQFRKQMGCTPGQYRDRYAVPCS